MAYLSISDFKYGMDRRRPQSHGVPGTLWILKNAHITSGGDVERDKKWVPVHDLPEGTFGLHMLRGQPYVFGSGSAPGGLPVSVQYQQLAAPGSPDMVRVLSSTAFDGKLYVIAEYDDGNIHHFYDGSRIAGWDTLADDNSSYEAVAELLATKVEASGVVRARVASNTVEITARTPGTAFTCTAAATDNGGASTPTATRSAVQANVAEVEEVVATGSVQITAGSFNTLQNYISALTVDGTPLLASQVNWVTSNSATANALAIEINNNSATSGYSAVATDDTVTISAAPGTGATPNGYVVDTVTVGDVVTVDTNMADGVAAVSPVAQVDKVVIGGGSFDAEDLWSITLNGTTYKATGRAAGTGTYAFVLKKRVWAVARSLLRYCQLNDASDWTTTTTPASDAGFINISNEGEGAQRLVGIAKYNGQAAIFSRESITIYALSTDATENEFVNTLESTGAVASRCIIPYGNNDVYYLSDTGVRSIRSREGTDTPFVSDVGSAIDPFVKEAMASAGADTLARATAIIDPYDGRYLLALDDKILSFSYFPASKITAWGYGEPGFEASDLAKSRQELYARSGDTIYLYGGYDGNEYPGDDEQIAVAETPFMAANDPAAIKMIEGFDAGLFGDWHVEVLVDMNDPSKSLDVDAGILNKSTYGLPHIKIPGRSSHIAFRLTCNKAGYASFSSLALHYSKEGAQ